MKNRNLFLTVLFSAIVFVWIHPQTLLAQGSSVQIIDKGNYYQVTMDYTSGIILKDSYLTGQTDPVASDYPYRISYYNMGVQLGQKILQTKPDYEQLVDSYIASFGQQNYDTFMCRVHDIKPQIHQEYQDEIDRIASQFSGGEGKYHGG